MLQVRSAPLVVVACQRLHINIVTAVGCCAHWATATCCHLTLTTSDVVFSTVLSAAAAAAAPPMQHGDKDVVQAAAPEQILFY